MERFERIVSLLISQIVAYLITATGILIIAWLWFKNPSIEKIIGIIVTGVYVFACIIAGIIYVHKPVKRRFIWGLIAGFCYFMIMLSISYYVTGENMSTLMLKNILPLSICAASGMLGGILGRKNT